jgi:hypothetical protein
MLVTFAELLLQQLIFYSENREYERSLKAAVHMCHFKVTVVTIYVFFAQNE